VGNYPALQFSTTVVILEFAAFANEGSGRAARCLASCARQQPRVWPASILGSFSASLRRSPKHKSPLGRPSPRGPILPSRLYENHPKYRKSKSSEIGHRSNPSQNGKAPV